MTTNKRGYWKSVLLIAFTAVFAVLTGCQSGAGIPPQNGEEQTSSVQREIKPTRDPGEEKTHLVYLSPSKQFDNDYVIEGTEGQYMNLIAEAIIPYLEASGVKYILADKEDDLKIRTEKANQAKCDLYLSIHSNGADGQTRGTLIFYQKDNDESEQFAKTIASNMKKVSPTPNRVFTQFDPWQEGEKGYIETREPNGMSALVEVAYHDNVEDATWIVNHVEEIAASLARAITDTLGVEFSEP